MDENTLNGFGRRVNDAEKDIREVQIKTDRNTKDIENVWEGINNLRESLNSMPWKIMAMIAIPTLLLIYQILIK